MLSFDVTKKSLRTQARAVVICIPCKKLYEFPITRRPIRTSLAIGALALAYTLVFPPLFAILRWLGDGPVAFLLSMPVFIAIGAFAPFVFMRPFFHLLPSTALEELTAISEQLRSRGHSAEAAAADSERQLILRILGHTASQSSLTETTAPISRSPDSK